MNDNVNQPYVLYEVADAVATLILNNPSSLNAMTQTMITDVHRALDDAISDPAVRAILITGAGKGFCSGAYLAGEELVGFSSGIGAHIEATLNPLLRAMREAPKPIVGCINGAAAGAGVGIALACDVTIAAKSAKFVLSFSRIGACLDGGTSWILQRMVGVAKARALALIGHSIDADTAMRWGLVWDVQSDADILEYSLDIARQLADGPPRALGAIKSQLNAATVLSFEEALTLEASLQAAMFETDDFREGVEAYQQRRKPKFRGN